MIFNNSVTLYHQTDDGYERTYFVRACVFNEDKIETGHGGHVEKNIMLVRIFTSDHPDISSGDRFVLGYCDSLSPPEDSHIILSVTKNCRGSVPTRHYKIEGM